MDQAIEGVSEPQSRKTHPNLIMMGLYLAAFVGMFGETSLNIAMPALVQAFNVDVSLMQWMVIGHMLVIGIVLPMASILMKWFSVRSLSIFAIVMFLIGSLISGFAVNFPMLLAGRMIQGFGPGLVLPMMFALVLKVFPLNKIGSAMGFCALIIMFAPAVGPTLAGFIIEFASWRWVFFTFAIILVVALAFVLKFIVSPYELDKPHIDAFSCIMSVIGFGGLVMGVGFASLFGWISAPTLITLAIGIVCLAAYVKRQLKLDVPVLNMRVFGIKGFRMGAICVMLTFGITMSAMFLMPQFVQSGMMLPVALTGIVLLPGGVANAIFSLIGGKLYDKMGARGPACVGYALAAISSGLLMFSTPETPAWMLILCHVVLLSGVPLAMSPSQTNALDSLPPEVSTDGSAILNTMQQIWGAICTAIATSLLGIGSMAFEGSDPTGSLSFTNGFHYGVTFTLVLAVLGFIAAFGLKTGRRTVAAPQQPTEIMSPLRRIMKTDVFVIPENASLLEALQFITDHKISGAPVVNEMGAPVGFISDGDILRYLAHKNPMFVNAYSLAVIREAGQDAVANIGELLDMKVSDVFTRKLVCVDVNDDLGEICRILEERHIKKAPVMENGTMVGVINRSNVSKYALGIYLESKQTA